MMKNLLSMEHLSNEEIIAILDRARDFENGKQSQLKRSYNVANLFFEPSTRTKTSFEMRRERNIIYAYKAIKKYNSHKLNIHGNFYMS